MINLRHNAKDRILAKLNELNAVKKRFLPKADNHPDLRYEVDIGIVGF